MKSEEKNNFIESRQFKSLPHTIQFWLSVFAFFLAFPVIDIAGISITFFIFFYILLLHIRYGYKIIYRNNINKWFILLFIIGLISTIFHPPLNIEVSVLSDLKTISQYFYWFVLALYILSNYSRIDWYKISYTVFTGLIALVIGYYFLPIKAEIGIITISFKLSRNGFVYNMLSFLPFTIWYLQTSRFNKIKALTILFFVVSVLFSNGRAGFVLIVLQSILIGMVVYPSLRKLFRISLIAFFLLFLVWQYYSETEIFKGIAEYVETINPRAAELLQKEGSAGDLSEDKSWTLRKLMVDKTFEILKEHPLLGVGWMHFTRYFTELESLSDYPRLISSGHEFLNTRSSHNSYILYLAEGGILGFAILIIILIKCINPITKILLKNKLNINHLPFISLFILLIYFYAITAITGANTWFVLGSALGIINNHKTII